MKTSNTTLAADPSNSNSYSNGTLNNIPKRMSSSSLTGAGESSTDNTNNDVLAAAAQSGGISKATWRNRQQEENDPDFQRGAGLLRTSMMMPTAPVFVPGQSPYFYGQTAGYPTPSSHPQQHHMPSSYHQAAYVGDGRGGGGDNSNNNTMQPPAGGLGLMTPQQRIRYGYGPQVQIQSTHQQQPQYQQPEPYRSGNGPPGSRNDASVSLNNLVEPTNFDRLEEFPALR